MTIQAKTNLGVRVKSGFAIAVQVVGSSENPKVVSRHVLSMSDDMFPESKQPYHATMGVLEQDDLKIGQRVGIVEAVTTKSVRELLDDIRAAGRDINGAGLVVGSVVDPKSISSPHVRAHTLEGALFRNVLKSALESHGIGCAVFVERTIYRDASEALSRSEAQLKSTLANLGRSLGGQWRAEEKLAALSGWIMLGGHQAGQSH
jgi:hypothetical protein